MTFKTGKLICEKICHREFILFREITANKKKLRLESCCYRNWDLGDGARQGTGFNLCFTKTCRTISPFNLYAYKTDENKN